MDITDIDDLNDMMSSSCTLYENNNSSIIDYINTLNISQENIKEKLIWLAKNDNYNDYIDIYNICIENGIELPPI